MNGKRGGVGYSIDRDANGTVGIITAEESTGRRGGRAGKL